MLSAAVVHTNAALVCIRNNQRSIRKHRYTFIGSRFFLIVTIDRPVRIRTGRPGAAVAEQLMAIASDVPLTVTLDGGRCTNCN